MALEDSRLVWFTLVQTFAGATYNTRFTYRTETPPTMAELVTSVNDFVDEMVPIVNALQHSGVTNVRLDGSVRRDPFRTYSLTFAGTGSMLGDDEDKPRPQTSYYFRKYVAESFEWFTGDPVLDRPIQRGGVFLPGITEDWIYNGGLIVPSGMETALDAFNVAFADNFVVGTVIYSPIVYGAELAEVTGDDPHPERPECFADVDSIALVNQTWLHNRHP